MGFENPSDQRLMRCAIYTRKSVATNLDKPLNSIETQREVCGAYIRSQAHRHWTEIVERYDDGGFSGGTLIRPALQRLVTDIEAGRVDIVVIYKVDRLSRSLTDFVRLMDVLNRYGASFVSVTQSFDTSDSMGRLILNILLTFAQFERELCSERLRDRCAARRKMGLFAGGMPPIGYLVKKNGMLVPDPQRAEAVKELFEDFPAMSANRLGQRLEARGFKTITFGCRHHDTARAQKFPATNILKILRNPLYAGYFLRDGELVRSKVEPLVGLEQWQLVQDVIRTRYPCKRDPVANLLIGLLHDEAGRRMKVVKGSGGTKRPRYYQSDSTGWATNLGVKRIHVDAEKVEDLTQATLTAFLRDRSKLKDAVLSLGHYSTATPKLLGAGSLAARRIDLMDRPMLRLLYQALVVRIDVTRAQLQLLVCCYELCRLLEWDGEGVFRRAPIRPRGADRFRMVYAPASLICTRAEIVMPIKARPDTDRVPESSLVDLLAKAASYEQFMLDNREFSLGELAARKRMSGKLLARFLRLNYLAPDIKAAIVDGTQPPDLTRNHLLFGSQPLDWDQQRRLYGFA